MVDSRPWTVDSDNLTGGVLSHGRATTVHRPLSTVTDQPERREHCLREYCLDERIP